MNHDTFKALLNAQKDAKELHEVVEGFKAVSPTIRLQVAKLLDSMTAAVGMAHRDVIINALVDSGASELTHTELARLDVIELQEKLHEALNKVTAFHITVEGVEDLEDFFQCLEARLNEEALNVAEESCEVEEVPAELAQEFERYMDAEPASSHHPEFDEDAGLAVEGEFHPEVQGAEEEVNLVLTENAVERGEVDADGAPYVADELDEV